MCGCLPALPRAFALCRSNISSRLMRYRNARPKSSQSSQVKTLGFSGINKSLVSGDTLDNYYQLRGGDDTKSSAMISESTREVYSSNSESELHV